VRDEGKIKSYSKKQIGYGKEKKKKKLFDNQNERNDTRQLIDKGYFLLSGAFNKSSL